MRRISVFFILTLCLTSIFAQQTKRVHPDKATHYIKGDFTASMQDGKPVYELRHVTTEGISFHRSDVYDGKIDDAFGDLKFTFDSARTTYPGGFAENELAFWFYDKEIGEWQPDIEIRQATGSFDNRKIMTIMLVLDCSTSLGKDFSKVKSGAKYFLEKLVSVSNIGNVRIGIIGFSSLKNTNKSIFPIQKLTATNYQGMLSFIDNLTMDNGTALYYAIDKSVNIMERYATSLAGEDLENYARSCVVTFTDGIDQTSQDLTNGILNADVYYEKVKDDVIKRFIKGKKIDSYVISVRGVDITSTGMINKFDRVLKNIVSAKDNYLYIEQISGLRSKFGEIADNLINSWQVLNCYVPAARQGQVCWTMGEEKQEPIVKEKTMLLGLNLSGIIPMYFSDHYCCEQTSMNGLLRKGFDMSIGWDFAYPITRKFGLGMYMNYGLGFGFEDEHDCHYNYGGYGSHYGGYGSHYGGYDYTYFDPSKSYHDSDKHRRWEMSIGLLMTMGDMGKRGAFLLGIGANILGNYYNWRDGSAMNVRLGFVDRSGFYMSFDLGTDFGSGEKDCYIVSDYVEGSGYKNFERVDWDVTYFRPSITIGYNFGALYKVR